MRITTQAKRETNARILAAARARFGQQGFLASSTRDIAADAGIAAGTLFNYFPNKESLAMSLLDSALDEAQPTWRARRRTADTLVEDLFAHVATGLRALAPYRDWVGEVLETAMSPFARSSVSREGDALRASHLECVSEILGDHAEPGAEPPGFVSIHLYWTLYLGVLAYWSGDASKNQTDSLVVLDQSLALFAASLQQGNGDGSTIPSSPSTGPSAGTES
jgi:AcrR family transcriptional regulator